MVQLSIDESIKRLKAEIIAQDWGLSEKRIELLDAAFSCLKQRFKNRKAAHAILIMAGSVLEYVKRKGENTPSDSIDFLKEAMAHVVNLYETDEFDLEKDEKLFKGLYFRFNTLKEKIKAEKERGGRSAEEAAAPLHIQKDAREQEIDRDTLVPESIEELRKKVSALRQADLDLEKGEVERLVHDLQASLERAEYVGETIRQLLKELLAANKARGQEETADNELYEDEGEEDEEIPDFSRVVETPRAVEENPIKNCPATELRKIVLGGVSVYLQESAIAMIREVSKQKLKAYLKTSNVPLKDFAGLFQGLAKQFSGSLANIPDKKLKKLSLPLMIPSGFNLPDIPDENGCSLVVVTNGQWNGVLACSEVENEPVAMVKFKKAKNGDIVGIGFDMAGMEFPLLNAVSVLRREGFLTMV
ncbi:MAG: hypothetical protein KQH63_16670 [Desulfobulbaceae bacterium]|nr:hypothetical protein [Desulfobulbaceae bacterium]